MLQKKESTGYLKTINGRLYARITFTGADGKRHDLSRAVPSQTKTEGKEILKQLQEEINKRGTAVVSAPKLKTFAELAAWYRKTELHDPVYVGDRKVAGKRGVRQASVHFASVEAYFGRWELGAISRSAVQEYQKHRLKQPKKTKRTDAAGKPIFEGQRSIATVNRELAEFRRVMNLAYLEGWLVIDPKILFKGLIRTADETRRTRTIDAAEEAILLDACKGTREHLRPLLICLIDTGLRHSEMMGLTWGDIDLAGRKIRVIAKNAKTARERYVGISARLLDELTEMRRRTPFSDETIREDRIWPWPVFPKKAWYAMLRDVNIKDLRSYDCCHTFGTRIHSAGMSIGQTANLMGHSKIETTLRYVNATKETPVIAADLMDQVNAENAKRK